MAIPQLKWDVAFLKNNSVLKSSSYGIPVELKSIHYPIRLIRYWFTYHLLRLEANKVNGGLSVCEIGVDTGQMLGFMNAAETSTKSKVAIKNWDAIDCLIRKEILEPVGYKNFYEVDLEGADFQLDPHQQYDAMVMLHVLEHLFNPEALITKLVPHLKEGGAMIGGFPSLPKCMEQAREKKIRPKARKFGHVSVFSPERVMKMAKDNGLEVEFFSGAFLFRKKGFFLENFVWWFRFNLWFGAMFPAWPGETYWLIRKPKI